MAPDGGRAGIVWEVASPGMEVIIPPEEDRDRWGVYKVGFARLVHDEEGLVEQLREWLPELRRVYLKWQAGRSS